MPHPLQIDMHMHVGLLGDKWPELGHFSSWYRRQITYQLFLFYARMDEEKVSDITLKDAVLKTIDTCGLDKVVCLALDPVFDSKGMRRTDLSHVWVDNDFIIKKLRAELPEKVLLGASVHPYDSGFVDRARKYVDEKAVLIKWLPSAQQIDLADEKTGKAMRALATIRDGQPLPLLLHVGPEYAIPTSDDRTRSYDYLSWSWSDKMLNFFKAKKNRWHTPRLQQIHDNIRAALDEGAIIIFAHAGLPYFTSRLLARFLEHSDFKAIKDFLDRTQKGDFRGKCYTDVSALCTPFRSKYFPEIKKLPPDLLLFGSDFPTPAFELSAGIGEMLNDFKAVLNGQLYRIIVPQDNLLDVNLRELQAVFPGHPMFTNFSRLIDTLKLLD